MKAIVFTQYGSPDVLQFKEVDKPLPQEHQVLVKVHAASVNALDRHSLHRSIIMGNGFSKPKDQRVGVDLAGRVEEVGSTVTKFHPGDEVYGIGAGAFAEYACARADALAMKPTTVSF